MPEVLDSVKTHPRDSQCSSEFLVDKRHDDSNLVSFDSSTFQSNLPSLASTRGRCVFNKTELLASNECDSCPKQSFLGNRCIEFLLAGSGQLCVLIKGLNPSDDSKGNSL